MDFNNNAPLLICVIVNWNGWQDTIACLDSLRQQDYPNFQVIVVDNGSTNDSRQRICQAHSWATLVETGKNLGFPSGCNVGTRLAYHRNADYIWLLNNDTVAPADTASKMMRKALATPGAGAIGSVLYYMHDPSKVQAWGGGSISLWSGYVSHVYGPAKLGPGSFITGASLLMPRRVCEQVGIFFEGFFMYCDDTDLCLRLHRAGYSLLVAEDTAILHKEGGSSPRRSPIIDQFATTSTMRLLRRNASLPALSIAVYLALRLVNRIRCREWSNFAAVIRGLRVFIRERKISFTDRL